MTAPFGRPTLMVASLQVPVAKALAQFVELFLGEHLIHSFPDENAVPLRCVEDLHTRLDSLDRHVLFDTVCVVDLTSESTAWDITRPEAGMRPSELVLRYPGVYWIFLVRDKSFALTKNNAAQELHCVDLGEMAQLANLLKRHADGFRAWFDPTGLRRTVRGETQVCKKYAAAIDDETDFSTLNGYVLYQNNYPTYVISTFSEMNEVLGNKQKERSLAVVMEDVELNFSDLQDKDKTLLFTSTKEGKARGIAKVLEDRKEEFTPLQNARRIFVSSVSDIPVTRPQDSFVTKPYGGMFARELESLRGAVENSSDKEQYKQSPSDGHSVGNSRAQQVAAGLLERAKQAANNVCTTEAAIHVALMALDARRLLRGECLSLSLEALALQHKMEVIAECTFIGTASQLAVKERFSSLNEDIKKIVGEKKYGSHQINNALVEIADDIRRIYSEYDQFVEEEEAIIRLRKYEWTLRYWSCQPGEGVHRVVPIALSLPKLIFAGVPEYYFNHVVSRLWKMGLWIGIWIVIFALIYTGLNLDGITELKDSRQIGFHEWILHSTANFLAPGTGVLDDIRLGKAPIRCISSLTGQNLEAFRRYWYVSLTEMLFGFIHLGIFISYFFQKISRR